MTPSTVVDGIEIDGNFRLALNGYNATESEMENALVALSTITSVDVEWGAVDRLVLIYSDTLTYSSASSMDNMTSDDGNGLGGNFKLEYNGYNGYNDYDATAPELSFALEQLGTIPSAVRLR